MLIELNRNEYDVQENEFRPYINETFFNLKMVNDLPECEILVGLINDIVEMHNNVNLYTYGLNFGGYLILNNNCSKVYCLNLTNDEKEILLKNKKYNENIIINETNYIDDTLSIYLNHFPNNNYDNYIISDQIQENGMMNRYKVNLEGTNKYVYLYVPNKYINLFNENFKYYMNNNDNEMTYNNLVQLVMIVKNACGDFENKFKEILKNNAKYIDRYTILDTGSNDNTINIIKEVLAHKKGSIYQEPFINFRESRNRSLELAGTKCKFNLILDDTYLIKNNLRNFLITTRSDQFSDSNSIFIKSDDVMYCSNRITKSSTNLRYIYTIHEVISDKNNVNVMIPLEEGYIEDIQDKYMEKRTYERKKLDIVLLNEMVKEDPENPRHFYYLANTYKLLGDNEKTEENYLKRIYHKNVGFKSELIDATFELARFYNFTLNKSWDECYKYYKMSYDLDPERPEPLYFIGIHYFLENNKKLAYDNFKKAFEIGLPIEKQYSVKPTLSLYFLPLYLVPLCYDVKDFELGHKCSLYFLQNNPPTVDNYNMIKEWYAIFNKLIMMPPKSKPIILNEKLICFVADGGFNEWSGSDIDKKGVGGSETHVIEMARNMKRIMNDSEIIVFCNTKLINNKVEICDGVKYIPLSEFYKVCTTYYIDTCIISRYSEYIPVAINSYVENIYVFAHDLTLSGNLIPLSPKIKKIFCLTEWHKEYFNNQMKGISHLTEALNYGINTFKFPKREKQKYKFIFSSFANRGLLPLLLMWERIQAMYPTAELHTYCDLENEWLNKNYGEVVIKIKSLLPTLKNVFMHGWVSKSELYEAWATSHIWLYPCTFMETFCLTAFEAAASKTLVITNNLAALKETAGKYSISVEGEPMNDSWQETVLTLLMNLNNIDTEEIVNNNYSRVKEITWENQAIKLIDIINKHNTNGKETFKWTSELFE